MEYYLEFTNSTVIKLDPLFVKNSQLIQNMLSTFTSNIIPVVSENVTEERVRGIEELLRHLELGEGENICRRENLEEVVNLLNIVDYYDIKPVRDYMMNFLERLVRGCGSVGEMEKLFGKKI